MKIWLQQHLLAMGDALRHLLQVPSGFALNVLVIGIALALPFAGLTLLENVRPISEQLAVEPEISLFIRIDTPRKEAIALAGAIHTILQKHQHEASVLFIPREEALANLKNKTGMVDALNTLGHNPLPDVYVLKLTGFPNTPNAQHVNAITAELQAMPGVDNVQIDSEWLKRLTVLLGILRLALLFLAITLSVVVVAVVFNTVRLQVLTQREEIVVSKLVGATDAFIHRPFYYTGALLGLCAGSLALMTVALGLRPLNQEITEFAHLYASEFRLLPLTLPATLALLALSAGLGLVGAVLSVRKHLARLT